MKKALSLLLTLNLIFPASIFAADIKINSNMNLRISSKTKSGRYELKTLTTLPRGTILEIPDEFVIMNGDKINANATINNWINKNRLGATQYHDNGKTKFDHFFKVKVKSGRYKNHTGFVALKYLAERKGMELTTVTSAELHQEVPWINHDQSLNPVTEAKMCVGDCGEDSSFIVKLKKHLNRALTEVKNKTNRFVENKRSNGTFKTMINNFEQNCFGIQFNDYANLIKTKSAANNIPAEVMLGIFTQETAGFCQGPQATGDVKSSSKSLGPFQVNTGSSSVDPCTSTQLKNLRGKTLAQMETDTALRCLQNPAVNLQEGIRIYLSKYRAVNNGESPAVNGAWSTISIQESDKHRNALAAYNGGEGWVNLAKTDVQIAAKNYGITLKDDWETRRLFFTRQILKKNGYTISSQRSSRSYANSVGNLAYVEAILGRSTANGIQEGYAHHWEDVIRDRPRNLVATR